MLFAIGAGPQIVAVGSFDRFPPEVEKLPRVGALIDPDVERILSLRPDLVVIYASQTDLRTQLERAQIPIYIYSHAGLADITVTIRALGARVGRERPANDLAAGIETRIKAVSNRVAGLRRPRTLVVFERESMTLRGIYASGGIGFIHDMVEAAGGTNLFAGRSSLQRRRCGRRRPGRRCGQFPRSAPGVSTSSPTSVRSSPGRASPKRSSSSHGRCTRMRSNEEHVVSSATQRIRPAPAAG
jgi:hypothetical protein